MKQKVLTKPISSDSDDSDNKNERGVEKMAVCKKRMVFNKCAVKKCKAP